MIISFEKKFIFVAIPKTAGHAIRAGLRPLMGVKDWEQCSLFEKKSCPVPALAKFDHGHLTAHQIETILPPGTYAGFFSFAFVRNPYDRFVSFNAFAHRGADRMRRDPLGTMKGTFEKPQWLRHKLMQPQHEFTARPDGTPMLSHVARYEDIQHEFDQIRAHIGAKSIPLPKVNTSEHLPYHDYYDDELQQMVLHHYAADFDLFGYNKTL